MAGADNFSISVFHRASELVDPGVRWQRGLWNPGLVLCLKELIESSDAVQAGALSPAAVKWLADHAKGRLMSDPGAGSPAERKAIGTLLTRDLSSGGANYRELRQWITAIEGSYLSRWVAAASSEDERPSRETCARALAAHLLDRGFSQAALTSWLDNVEFSQARGTVRGSTCALPGPLPQAFDVMILFEKPPPARIARPEQWRDARQASKRWPECQGFSAPRQHGGLLLSIEAKDGFGAASQAADAVDQLLVRVSVRHPGHGPHHSECLYLGARDAGKPASGPTSGGASAREGGSPPAPGAHRAGR